MLRKWPDLIQDAQRLVPHLMVGALVAAAMFCAAMALFGAGSQPPDLSSTLRDAVRRPSTYVNARILSAGVPVTETVPTFAGSATASRVEAVFFASCPVYYFSSNGTAAEPTVDATDGSSSEGNPAALQFSQGASFMLVAPTACKVTIAYYFSRF